MRVFGLVRTYSPVFWTFACLAAASGVAIGANVLSVDTADPAIRQFKAQAKAKSGVHPDFAAAPDELRRAVGGLKVPVLDLTKPPNLSTASPPAKRKSVRDAAPVTPQEAPKLTVSSDDTEGKNWYSITREYTNPKVTITVSADLRVLNAPENFVANRKNRNAIEVSTAPRKPSKDEDFPEARIVLYKFPNIPYVIHVECTPESRYICTSKDTLIRLTKSLGLIEAP